MFFEHMERRREERQTDQVREAGNWTTIRNNKKQEETKKKQGETRRDKERLFGQKKKFDASLLTSD